MSKACAEKHPERIVITMREHSLEIYVMPLAREITCFISSPCFGSPAPLPKHAKKYVTLNDGHNRVYVGVFNHDLEIERIKHIARAALSR